MGRKSEGLSRLDTGEVLRTSIGTQDGNLQTGTQFVRRVEEGQSTKSALRYEGSPTDFDWDSGWQLTNWNTICKKGEYDIYDVGTLGTL